MNKMQIGKYLHYTAGLAIAGVGFTSLFRGQNGWVNNETDKDKEFSILKMHDVVCTHTGLPFSAKHSFQSDRNFMLLDANNITPFVLESRKITLPMKYSPGWFSHRDFMYAREITNAYDAFGKHVGYKKIESLYIQRWSPLYMSVLDDDIREVINVATVEHMTEYDSIAVDAVFACSKYGLKLSNTPTQYIVRYKMTDDSPIVQKTYI